MINTSHLNPSQSQKLAVLMGFKRAPLTAQTLSYLWSGAAAVDVCASRKGISRTPDQLRQDQTLAAEQFELGCWLHFYSLRVLDPQMTAFRIDCLRRILLSDLNDCSPGNGFHAVFDFSQREFEAILEMGDVTDVLQAIAPLQTLPSIRRKLEQAGWHRLLDPQELT